MQPSHGTESCITKRQLYFPIHLLPLYAFMAWTGSTLPLLFEIHPLTVNCSRDILFWNQVTCHVCSYHQRDKEEKLFQLFHGESITVHGNSQGFLNIRPPFSHCDSILHEVLGDCIFSLFLNPLMTDIYLHCILI